MKIETCIKETFVVIGKEGSTTDGQNGPFLAMNIFVQRLKANILFQMCWTI